MRRISVAIAVLTCIGSISTARSQESLETLLEKLASQDAGQRQQAVDELGDYTSQKSLVPRLTKALGDSDAGVRWRAALALGRFGPNAEPAVEALARALADEDTLVRAHAARSLGEIGPGAKSAAPGLAKALLDEDRRVRREVVDALEEIRPGAAVTIPLLTKVLNDGEPSVVVQALETLAELGGEVVPFLIEALSDKNACYWACLVLADIGPDASPAVGSLMTTTESDEPEVRMQSLMALAAIGPSAAEAVPVVVAAMKDQENSVRYAAVYAFAKIGKKDAKGIENLRSMIRHEDAFLQMVSAYAVARLYPDDKPTFDKVVRLLVAKLKDRDPHVRSGAARALIELDPPSEVSAEALVEALSDAEPEVLAHVAEAVAAQGEAAVPRLIRGLKNEKLKTMAVMVLDRLGPAAKAAVPAMVESLDGADAKYRAETQFALGAIGPGAASAVSRLVKSLGDADPQVRVSACYALGKIGPQAAAAVPALKTNLKSDDHLVRVVSAMALIGIRPDDAELAQVTVPIVAEGLQHENELVCVESVRALAHLGPLAKPAIPALQKSAEGISELVREEAKAAMEKINAN